MFYYLKRVGRYLKQILPTFVDSLSYSRETWHHHSRGRVRDIFDFQVLLFEDLRTAFSIHRRASRHKAQ